MKPLLLTNKELLKYQISTGFKCLFLDSPIENNKASSEGEVMDVFRTYGISSIYQQCLYIIAEDIKTLQISLPKHFKLKLKGRSPRHHEYSLKVQV